MPTNASTPYKREYKAPQPRREVFDPYNSASTGHQRAESRIAGSTGWRDSRTHKINAQFDAGVGGGGGKRIFDLVGAGSEDFGSDGRTDVGWDDSVQGWRGRQGITHQGWGNVGDMLNGQQQSAKAKLPNPSNEEEGNEYGMPPPSAQPPPDRDDEEGDPAEDSVKEDPARSKMSTRHQRASIPQEDSTVTNIPKSTRTKPETPQIFSSLTILINGSTYPTISDHRLKYLLTAHGARLSISHSRRQVTHVIIGRPSSTGSDSSKNGTSIAAGGGLAGGKLEKEVLKKSSGGGLSKGVRYVSVEWVTDSVKAGIRLPEARYPGVSIAPRGVRSVRDMLKGG